MAGSLLLGEEQAGGLDDVLGAHFVPLQVGGILFAGHADFAAVHDDGMVGVIDGAFELAVDGVIFEHISHIIRGDEVVDGNNFNFRVGQAGAEDQTADAAEAVDTNFDHGDYLLIIFHTLFYLKSRRFTSLRELFICSILETVKLNVVGRRKRAAGLHIFHHLPGGILKNRCCISRAGVI